MVNTPTLAVIGIPEKGGQWPEKVQHTKWLKQINGEKNLNFMHNKYIICNLNIYSDFCLF